MGVKTVALLSDPHSGHIASLTHPDYQQDDQPYSELQSEIWAWFAADIKSVGKIDVAAWLGDMIEGKGERSGSTELVETDRRKQAGHAVALMQYVNARKNVMAFGTPSHVGKEEDWESVIADTMDCPIHSHQFIDVNGLIFSLKHKVGGSQIPHGRHTAIARERLWNVMWSEHEEQVKAHIIARGHVHYFSYCGGENWLGMTLPALQAPNTKYGGRQCSGTVSFGYVIFRIDDKGNYTWQPRLLHIKATSVRPIKF